MIDTQDAQDIVNALLEDNNQLRNEKILLKAQIAKLQRQLESTSDKDRPDTESSPS